MAERGFSVGNRKGKLSEYIEAIPNGYEMVDQVYNSLNKDRVTKSHGALYDCVMTYVVFVQYIIKNGGL